MLESPSLNAITVMYHRASFPTSHRFAHSGPYLELTLWYYNSPLLRCRLKGSIKKSVEQRSRRNEQSTTARIQNRSFFFYLSP